MKKFLLLLFLFTLGKQVFANHITGGTIFYTLNSVNGNSYTYDVTLLLYKNFGSGAELDASASIAVFSNADNSMVWPTGNPAQSTIPLLDTVHLRLKSPDPCISNPPAIWYVVGRYRFQVTLQGSAAGYTIAYQRCCRIIDINNIAPPSTSVGATYTAQIPGTNTITTIPAPRNNSARFGGKDTVVICANNQFCYDFSAVDPDPTDSLAYYFCTAYTSQSTPTPQPVPPANPNYIPIPYQSPYNAGSPLGAGVSLNSETGILCGVAPPPGIYVVTVCVGEYRNGILIATQRKDLQIKVGDCDLVDAALPASFPICDDFTKTFQNNGNPALINTYNWSFGDPASGSNTSNLPSPTHTFSDTGVYTIKLVVNQGEACSDSATSIAYVFPGFFPKFGYQGICVNNPTNFFDSTTTVYGTVNSWKWDFGDLSTTTDVSNIKNPSYTYSATGTKNVRFIVTSSKGCIDTVFKDVIIVDKPPLQAIPKDTLICNGDVVQLNAVGTGNFSWSGPAIQSGGNTANPLVAPTVTSNYIVTLNQSGCVASDTMKVRVVDFVTLQAMADTVICATDSVQLTVFSDGLRFNWTPTATLNDPTLKNPKALPVVNTTYTVSATIGHCTSTDDVKVTLVPYPVAKVGADTTICFGQPAQLNATMVGSQFSWSPTNSLNNPNILNPVATPFATTRYIFSVTDVLGCPKPKKDTILVMVLPKIIPFAGNDTAVVVGQPLQFNATGGVSYTWTPSTGLSNPLIFNPIGSYDGGFDSIRYAVKVANILGCADTAYITVRVFKTSPQIFVPTAFTPNGDGRNDIFRPIAVGISKFDYFRVYNRWGQLVYETTRVGVGWDGRISGKEQGTNTFVWVVKGTDYTGKAVFAKGTVTLIR